MADEQIKDEAQQPEPIPHGSGATPSAPDPFDWDDPDLAVGQDVAFPQDNPGASDTEDEQDDDSEGADDTPVFTDDLLGRALELGLDEEDAKRFGSPETLERVLENLRPSSKTDTPGDKEKAEFRLDLDEDEVDPGVYAAFEKVKEHFQAEIEVLRDQLSEVSGHAADQRKQAQDAWLKDQIDKLDDSQRKLVSKTRDQAALADEIETIRAGLQARNKNVPTEDVLFSRAFRSLFGEQSKSLARDEVRDEVKKQQRQAISRPTHRETKNISRDAKAEETVRAFFAEKGWGEAPHEEF